jgi:hypothetical protein
MKYHGIGCTQLHLCSAMETRGNTIRDVITAVPWKGTTPVILTSVWNRRPLQMSRSESHVFCKLKYHDAVQRAANSS